MIYQDPCLAYIAEFLVPLKIRSPWLFPKHLIKQIFDSRNIHKIETKFVWDAMMYEFYHIDTNTRNMMSGGVFADCHK